MKALTDAFAEYARRCAAEPDQVRPMHVRGQEFRRLVQAALTDVARYRVSDSGKELNRIVQQIEAHNQLVGFMIRDAFYGRVADGKFDPAAVAAEFAQETRRDTASVTTLIPFDGLELPQDEVEFASGRFVRLTESWLSDFLEGQLLSGESGALQFVGMWALVTSTQLPNPPWGPTVFEWDSASTQIRRLADPWLNLVNLWCSDKVNACGAYQKSDSLLVSQHIRAIGVEEPARDYHTVDDGEDTWEQEEPFFRVRVDGADRFRLFLDTLSTRIVDTRRGTHRADTALRFFVRVAEPFWRHHVLGYGDDPDANEDLVIDGVTGLEAIYLAGEQRGKGQHIAMRAGELLENDIEPRRKLRKAIIDLYDLRSAILHGDARRDPAELQNAARLAEETLRRSLVAFLMLSGDHPRVVEGEYDQARAIANRGAVRL